jgi:hypothetical protein
MPIKSLCLLSRAERTLSVIVVTSHKGQERPGYHSVQYNDYWNLIPSLKGVNIQRERSKFGKIFNNWQHNREV